MRYADQKSRTVYDDIEVEVEDGITYFHSWNEDDEPEDYYKLSVGKARNFETLYDISITKIRNYENDFSIRHYEICEYELPYNLRGYFSGENKKEELTEEQFNKVKQEILNKL